jgi:hypothetical protein
MVTVNLRLAPTQLARLDARVSEMGLDRSRYIRALIYCDLAQRDAELGRRTAQQSSTAPSRKRNST